MKFRLPLVALMLFISTDFISQILPDRYTDPIFTSFTETTVTISTAVPSPQNSFSICSFFAQLPLNVDENSTIDVNLEMDILTPDGDTILRRPAVIIAFGGGFVQGSKDDLGMRLIADSLVKRGFVVGLIDYRLGMKVNDGDLSLRAVYRGIQDGRSAVRYFRNNADDPTLRIDPDNIYIGGHSAGAFIALHNLYLDKEDDRPDPTKNFGGFKDQLCLDCVGDNQGVSGKANAAFSLAGALGDLDYMESSADLPMILFHDDNDGTVSHNNAIPFGPLFDLFCGDLPIAYGSNSIQARATSLGIIHEYYETNGRGHDVHINGNDELYPDIIPNISNFFYQNLLKPSLQLAGPSVLCEGYSNGNYTGISSARYYDWAVTGGTINTGGNQLENKIEITWDPLAPAHTLSCTPYSIHGAKGDPIVLSIEIVGPGSNAYLQVSNQWEDTANWDRGHIPLPCDDVILPPSVATLQLFISENTEVKIRSLLINPGNELHVKQNADIQILGIE